jgi:hypothetical protein
LNAQLADRDRVVQSLQQSLQDSRKPLAPEARPQSNDGKGDASKPEISDQARIAALENLVSELSRPRFNVPVVDLEPGHTRGATNGSITTINVPRSASLFTLILHTSSKPADAEYSLEILAASGKSIFRGRGIKNTADNGLTLALSHHLIPAGRYTIRLYTLGAHRTGPIEQYVVDVRYR